MWNGWIILIQVKRLSGRFAGWYSRSVWFLTSCLQGKNSRRKKGSAVAEGNISCWGWVRAHGGRVRGRERERSTPSRLAVISDAKLFVAYSSKCAHFEHQNYRAIHTRQSGSDTNELIRIILSWLEFPFINAKIQCK